MKENKPTTHRLIIEYKTERERERIKIFRLNCMLNGNKTMREVVMEMIKKYNHYTTGLNTLKKLNP